MSNIVQFPSERQLCHWCAEYRHDVETLVLSPKASHKFGRPTLTICHHCIESWRFWAKDAVNRPNGKLRREP